MIQPFLLGLYWSLKIKRFCRWNRLLVQAGSVNISLGAWYCWYILKRSKTLKKAFYHLAPACLFITSVPLSGQCCLSKEVVVMTSWSKLILQRKRYLSPWVHTFNLPVSISMVATSVGDSEGISLVSIPNGLVAHHFFLESLWSTKVALFPGKKYI